MQLFRKLIKYYKPHMKLFYIDMACAFLVAVSDLFYPYIVKDIINDFIPNKNLRMLIVWAVVLLLIYIVKAFMNFVVQYWGHVMGVRFKAICERICSRTCSACPSHILTRTRPVQ